MEDINKELSLISSKISKVLGDENGNRIPPASGYLLIADNIIADADEQAASYLGYRRDEIIGNSFSGFLNHLPADPLKTSLTGESNPKNGGIKYEWLIRTQNGKVEEYEINIFPLRDHHIVFLVPAGKTGPENWMNELDRIESHEPDSRSQSMVLFRMSNERNKCYYFSKQWLKFTGKKLKEELNDGWVHHIYPQDFERVISTINDAFTRQIKYELSYRLIRSDGTPRFLFESGIPLYDVDGNFIGYLSVSVDFTGVRQSEEKININEESFKALAENAQVLFRMSDESGRFFYFSKQWIAFTGRNLQTEYGLQWMKHVHHEDYKALKECLDESFSNKRKYEIIYRIRNQIGRAHV